MDDTLKKKDLMIVKTAEARVNEIMARIKVFDRDGELWTDSLSVADVFGKSHDNLLKAIRKINEENQVVNLVSFNEIENIDSRGRVQPAFEMTETGFFALIARFNDQKDKDISLIRSCYFAEFDRLKKEKKTAVTNGNDILIGLSVKLTNMLEELKNQNVQNNVEHKEIKAEVIQFGGKVNKLENKVDELGGKVSGMETKLDNIVQMTEKRRNVSEPNKLIHYRYTFKQYDGKCPLCGNAQIIDGNRNPTEICQIDHFIDKTKNRLDQTWPLCSACNQELSNAKKDMSGIFYIDAKGRFDGYQAGLRMDMRKRPLQNSLFQHGWRKEG